MSNKKLDSLTQQMENYIECWKQFNHFINVARSKKFGAEDENQFLEVKSVLIQELELIFAAIEVNAPTNGDFAQLDSVRIHPHFQRYTREELAAKHLFVVAQRS